MNGESLKAAESELGRAARGYRGSPDFDVRQLGDALTAVQQSVRNTLVRSNPAHADELSRINAGFANLARVEDAAGRLGSKEGVFTAAQLSAAVRSADKSVRKNQFARGHALMQDLSDAGENVLGSKYPDSGSIGRLLLGGSAVGAGAVNPLIPGALGVASLPYLPVGRQIAAGLLARRPAGAEAVAEALRHVPAGLLAPAAYPALNN
jgi:hypothetical protein